MMWRISILRVERAAIALFSSAAFMAASAAPDASVRHAVPGHFNVPQTHAVGGVTAPAAADGTTNLVNNAGFESGKIDGGWYQCGDVSAYTTREHPHGGAYDQYSGTASGAGEPQGNSGVCQSITIPPGGMLTAQLYQLSDEADTNIAYQEGDLLDDHGNVVLNLYKTVNDKAAWVQGSWNLGAYAGRTYWLYFGVHGDGYPKLSTQQFLDDVVVTGSTSPVGEPTTHATAGPNARFRRRRQSRTAAAGPRALLGRLRS